MEYLPKSGELYRHFKNKLYQIVTVAVHSETGEQFVIYQALYGDYKVYARPLAMFLSEVDRKKYPDAVQKYRFERVKKNDVPKENTEENKEIEKKELTGEKETGTKKESVKNKEAEIKKQAEGNKEITENKLSVSSRMMDFFDADDLQEKYNILTSMRDEINDHMINNMAVVLDVVIPEGELDERYEALRRCIRTRQKYETNRLR